MAKTTTQKFGENMKKIRLEKGMSQGDICRSLGLDRAYISNVENGKQNLTLSTIDKVAKVLGVSVDQLLK
jgi:transcriptional regulator with XRE-family HTH domain